MFWSLIYTAVCLHTAYGQIAPPLYINISLNSVNIETLPEFNATSDQVNFRLWTRNLTSYIELKTGSLQNQTAFDPTKECKFIIHGYRSSFNATWYESITKGYLQKGDYNVIQVDWSGPAQVFYTRAAQYSKSVGYWVAQLLLDMHYTLGVPFTNFHLVGHSLGAQISGYVGAWIQKLANNSKVERITGMDPAGPLFLLASIKNRLDPSDASFVDIIHTDGGKYGYYPACGHVDFYPNGGIAPQPACITINMVKEVLGCSHVLAPVYFAESINSRGFIGKECFNYIAYMLRGCQSDKYETALMGENCENTARGKFYLTTNNKPPYAKNGSI